jgi:hypothetical protein
MTDVPSVAVRCYACSGRFAFHVDNDQAIAYHTPPYCKAFLAIETAIDAIRHAERCDMTIKSS